MATITLSTLENTSQSFVNESQNASIDPIVFGEKVGLMAKLFGCWHENMSRPFGQGDGTYRACLHCGARKRFDIDTLRTVGKFYYPPIVKKIEIL